MRFVFFIFFIFIISVFPFGNAYPYEIGADPGNIHLTNVPLGTEFRAPNPITIYNQDSVARKFNIKVVNRAKSLLYNPLPDSTWVTLVRYSVEIPPESKSEPIEIILQIPPDEQYYNQHWQAQIFIGNASASGVGAGLIFDLKLDTESRTGVIPYGKFSVSPSSLELGTDMDSIIIYNNHYIPEKNVLIGWLSNSVQVPSDESTKLPEGLQVMDQQFLWHTPLTNFEIAKFDKKTIYISVGSKYIDNKYKGVLYFVAGNGKACFVNVEYN
ncbi:hypothetical protein JW877_07675 [bacterium]|nr:hypothetical protein [bacterium]